MRKEPDEKRFWYYVLPSMLTMVLSGFYAIVDGFFVGQATGDIGLGAINLAWPIAAVLQATGIGVGVGGSVLMSLYGGAGDRKKAALAKGNTLFTLALFSVLLMVVFYAVIRLSCRHSVHKGSFSLLLKPISAPYCSGLFFKSLDAG